MSSTINQHSHENTSDSNSNNKDESDRTAVSKIIGEVVGVAAIAKLISDNTTKEDQIDPDPSDPSQKKVYSSDEVINDSII